MGSLCFLRWMLRIHRGFRLVAMGKEGSETATSIRAVGPARKPLAGIGAALFLLVFVASEALATIGALRH